MSPGERIEQEVVRLAAMTAEDHTREAERRLAAAPYAEMSGETNALLRSLIHAQLAVAKGRNR